MTIIWYMVPEIWSAPDIIFCHLRSFFPLLPPNSLKNENFKKKKKNTERYHHFTEVYQKSWSYAILFLRYGMWQMYCYFSFWAILFPFTPITAQKMKISKKWKKAWRYHHFTQVYQKSWSYTILFLRYGTWRM